MSLLGLLNDDEKKYYSILRFIGMWVRIIDAVLIKQPRKKYFGLVFAEMNDLYKKGELQNNSISKLSDTIERKIHAAPTSENRLHLLCRIAEAVNYPDIEIALKHIYPETQCDEIPRATEFIENQESLRLAGINAKAWRKKTKRAREDCITSLMKKYNIPNQYRPRDIVYCNGYWGWNRKNELIARIISSNPDIDAGFVKDGISCALIGMGIVMHVIKFSLVTYSINESDIVNIQSKLNGDTNTKVKCGSNISTPKHANMPSTYRRAAVMALIERSGLCKNIDRTKKAAFVEAVTGGNINAKPKDSVSYKRPEQKAIDAATELLKTIGIE